MPLPDCFVGRRNRFLEKISTAATGFQIQESDLIQFIMEDILRHASGPVHISRICYIYFVICTKISYGLLITQYSPLDFLLG